MTHQRKKEKVLSKIEVKLARLEEIALEQGIQVHYDRLEAAGLKLQGGLCTVRGERHLFIERRRPVAEKVHLLEEYLEHNRNTVNKEDASDQNMLPRTDK